MKCPYCKVELPGDWRDKEHIKICKNVSPEVRYIHSGIPQKGYPPRKAVKNKEMTNREEFEKWVGNTSWTPYQKSIMFLAWQEAVTRQQKKIEELEEDNRFLSEKALAMNDLLLNTRLEIKKLKALNPDVECPACENQILSSETKKGVVQIEICEYCNHTGTVPLTKAQEYRIEQLEATINRMIEEAR